MLVGSFARITCISGCCQRTLSVIRDVFITEPLKLLLSQSDVDINNECYRLHSFVTVTLTVQNTCALCVVFSF